MRRLAQWAVFGLSYLLMALWFPFMFVRSDERPLLADNFGLDVPDDTDDRQGTGVFDAFARVLRRRSFSELGRLPHDVKNVLHEWVTQRPKLAAKFLPFMSIVSGALGALLVWVF